MWAATATGDPRCSSILPFSSPPSVAGGPEALAKTGFLRRPGMADFFKTVETFLTVEILSEKYRGERYCPPPNQFLQHIQQGTAVKTTSGHSNCSAWGNTQVDRL